jgi:hypothetical protein
VAFAGFSALVSAFDGRRANDDPRLRHYRVRVIVEYSVCVTIFSFVPYLLNAALGAEELAWRLSSLFLALAWSTIGLAATRRARIILGRSALRVAPTFSGISTMIGWSGATLLVFNALGMSIRSPGVSYIIGLSIPLLQSAMYFLRVVAAGDPFRGNERDTEGE